MMSMRSASVPSSAGGHLKPIANVGIETSIFFFTEVSRQAMSSRRAVVTDGALLRARRRILLRKLRDALRVHVADHTEHHVSRIVKCLMAGVKASRA